MSMTVAEERILGGQDAGFGQFPWTALIQIKGQQLDKMCAGTLVNSRYRERCFFGKFLDPQYIIWDLLETMGI